MPTTIRTMARCIYRLSTSKLPAEECSSKKMKRGALLFQVENKTSAYRSAHFGAKTSAWHWGRVSGALEHCSDSFRHAAWVYVDESLFLFPNSTAPVQFADQSPPTHWSTSVMEKTRIWQPHWMEWIDHQTIADDCEPSCLQSSEDTKPRFQLTATTLQKKP